MSASDESKGKKLGLGLKLIAPLCFSVCLLVALRVFGPQYLDQHRLSEWLRPLGVFAPVAFILLLGARPVTLLPGQLFAAVGGILFGTALGSVYALLGSLLSTSLIYALSHHFGQRAMKRLAGARAEAIQRAARGHGFLVGLFACTNMVIPADVVLAMASASGARFWPLALGAVVGSLPGTLLTAFFGSSLSQGKGWTTAASVAGLVVSLVTGLLLGRKLARELSVTRAAPSHPPRLEAFPRGAQAG